MADRTEVAITVYNGEFGLVHELRDLKLGTGRISLEFNDVSSQIEPQTVVIKSLLPSTDPDAPSNLSVLEQNYRYDLLSPEKLLEKYEGKKIKVYRWNKETGKDEEHEAEVLSTKNGTILKMGNEITYGFPGRYSFPEVPKNLISKPSLVWLVDSRAPAQSVEVTYLTRGLGWEADYVLTIGDEAATGATSKADLSGWVTLNNHTGTSFENAKLKLVAGDVQRVSGNDKSGRIQTRGGTGEGGGGFKEEGFFEYHLYALERSTNLLDNEQKQVTLLEKSGIDVTRKLRFFGQQYWYRSSYGQIQSNQKVGVYLEIDNSEKNHLGMALPKGTVRVYKADKSGAKQFVGEDAIDHTPRDEKVNIKVGESFDVVGDRKQMAYRVLSSCVSESDWEIVLRNHKDTADSVTIVEPIGGDWEVLTSSLPFHKEDANTFTFEAKVASRGNAKVTYTVRVRWC